MLKEAEINILNSKKIIKYLKEENKDLYNNWITICNSYNETLDAGPQYTSVAFTPHDFKHHSMNIYDILDRLLTEISISEVLTPEEIFILLVSVVLHDIQMAYDPSKRETHSELGKKFVEDQHSTSNSIINKNLTSGQAEAVGLVILSHSDLKEGKKINTLSLLPEKGNQPDGAYGEINVSTLGALLRIADELDVTSKRIEGMDIDEYAINQDSEQYWKQCKLFNAIRMYSPNTQTIQLQVNERVYDLSGDQENDLKCIRNVKNKIQEELDNINLILNKPGYLKGWTLSTIEIKARDEIKELLNELDKSDPLEEQSSGDSIKKK